MNRLALAIVIGTALAVGQRSQAGIIESTFDDDAEGWTAFGAVIEYQSFGGNPGGHLRVTDLPQTSYLIAPPDFLIDLRPFIGGMLSFDIIEFSHDKPFGGETGNVTIVGDLDSATANLIMPPLPTEWTTASIGFTAAEWGKTEAEWEALLSNVTEIRVVVDPSLGGLGNPDISGFDNFRLVPAPAGFAVLLLGSSLITVRRSRVGRAP